MHAYAVLAGGGAKGAALVGCLKAAEKLGITFEGYGGTSAGALIATLAAVGYTADELLEIMETTPFSSFVKDAGSRIDHLSEVLGALSLTKITRHYLTLRSVYQHLGLSTGDHLTDFVRKKIIAKRPVLEREARIEFKHLAGWAKPLKIVASDLLTKTPKVYSIENPQDSVTEAVRASTSYPFVFKPVLRGEGYVVDGGLCSNLPTFLFDSERENNGLPVIGFDLAAKVTPNAVRYSFKEFCLAMMDTALSSGDYLRRRNPGIEYVRVPVPDEISTLDFNLSAANITTLHTAGFAATLAYFATLAPQWQEARAVVPVGPGPTAAHHAQARTLVEMLQAAIGVPSSQVRPILRAMALDFETETPATHVRANIMLPTPRGTRIIVYQFGMDNDPDIDLELAADAGCSGRSWLLRRPTAADLMAARTTYAAEWGMTPDQQARVRADRQAMFSFPMFDPEIGDGHQQLIGVVSVDTATPLAQTGWTREEHPVALNLGIRWAEVVSRLLT